MAISLRRAPTRGHLINIFIGATVLAAVAAVLPIAAAIVTGSRPPLTHTAFASAPAGNYAIVSRPDAKATSNFLSLDTTWRASDALKLTGKLGTSTGHGKTPTQDVSETQPGTGAGTGFPGSGAAAGTGLPGSGAGAVGDGRSRRRPLGAPVEPPARLG